MKSMFFKDIAGLLLQTLPVCIFLKKASHCGTLEYKIDRLDCIYTEISSSTKLMFHLWCVIHILKT